MKYMQGNCIVEQTSGMNEFEYEQRSDCQVIDPIWFVLTLRDKGRSLH
jgi:hypothetical protein